MVILYRSPRELLYISYIYIYIGMHYIKNWYIYRIFLSFSVV